MMHIRSLKTVLGIMAIGGLSLFLTACPATTTPDPSPVNPAPVANNDTVTAIEGVATTFNVLANDTDAEAKANINLTSLDTSKVNITLAPTNGTAIANTNGTISYTSKSGFTGSDNLKYTVDDDEGKTSNEATVSITVTADEFNFASDLPSAYTRVDRMGMPAIATAVITSKNDYNAANPSDDASLKFASEIVTNLKGLHMALDDDLTGLGLTPCGVNPEDPFDPATSSCITQAAPLVVPDTLKIDTTAAAGFPNGRMLTDPVMDVTLAVVLLDLSVDGQTATSLVGVNPTQNDKVFITSTPYLAKPHTP